MPGSAIRFLVSGATTTIVTLGLYVALLGLVPYAIAYTVAFVAGILISYLLTSTFVFRAEASARTFALFPLVYLAQYLIGIVVVAIWVDVLGLSVTVAPLAAIAVTLPLTYIVTRRLFAERPESVRRRP